MWARVGPPKPIGKYVLVALESNSKIDSTFHKIKKKSIALQYLMILDGDRKLGSMTSYPLYVSSLWTNVCNPKM